MTFNPLSNAFDVFLTFFKCIPDFLSYFIVLTCTLSGISIVNKLLHN